MTKLYPGLWDSPLSRQKLNFDQPRLTRKHTDLHVVATMLREQ